MNPKDLLYRARREGTPLIDDDTVTFVWKARRAPLLIGDMTDWLEGEPIAAEKVGPNLWSYSTALAHDAYVEYAFLVGGKNRTDPFNPRQVDNGLGGFNQFFYMPGAEPSPLIERAPRVPRGQVTSLVLEMPRFVAGSHRTVYFYQPPVSEPVPLLVVFDGADYFRRGHLPTIVDNLIAQRRIQPIALAMVNNAGAMRSLEYGCSETIIGLLLKALLPAAQSVLNLVDIHAAPRSYGVLGASLGGLTALYSGLRLPDIFGRVASQSGAWTLEGYDTVVYDLIRYGPRRPLHIWMDCGRFERLLETNRRMFALLEEKGYGVTYNEYEAGHNYTAWRNDLWRGLQTLFPPST